MTQPVLAEDAPPAALYACDVMHARLKPVRHVFRYAVVSLVIDIDRAGEVADASRLFTHNRGWLAGFHDRDHGPRDGTPLRPWVEARLAEHGITPPGGPIRLLCFPRLFGYVFNPLSVYFCYDSQGRLGAVLHQVSNTFGQSHAYVAPVSADAAQPARHRAEKVFHVSPFIGMACTYEFRLHAPDRRVAVSIRQTEEGTPVLIARLKGTREAFTDGALRRLLWRFPFMTLKIIAAIHWEALRLWLKGVPLAPEPPLPDRPATRAEPDPASTRPDRLDIP
ncbi:MAG: DUF1365 domain-containing protein [Alphaproteobacteria bacterium]